MRWGIGAQMMRVIDYAHFDTMLYLWSLPNMRSMHKFLSLSQCALSNLTFISKVLEHQGLFLTFTCVYMKKHCIFVGLVGHIWPSKTIVKFVYLFFYLYYVSLSFWVIDILDKGPAWNGVWLSSYVVEAFLWITFWDFWSSNNIWQSIYVLVPWYSLFLLWFAFHIAFFFAYVGYALWNYLSIA